jgi:hypothetical protein
MRRRRRRSSRRRRKRRRGRRRRRKRRRRKHPFQKEMAALLLIPIKTKLKTCKYFLRAVTEKQLNNHVLIVSIFIWGDPRETGILY